MKINIVNNFIPVYDFTEKNFPAGSYVRLTSIGEAYMVLHWENGMAKTLKFSDGTIHRFTGCLWTEYEKLEPVEFTFRKI